jgi:ParB-like chromosome segregation protein Spo0J
MEFCMEIYCTYDKLVPLENLVPHPQNENRHPESQIELLAKIISKDGMRHPIIVSNLSGYIVIGHGRLAALKHLGVSEAPVVFQDFEDPIQELRVRTADNNIQQYSEFDQHQFNLNIEAMDLELAELDMGEFGIIPIALKEPSDLAPNEEIDIDDLTKNLKNTCPKCGFEYE